MTSDLRTLIRAVEKASPATRIDYRDRLAAHGEPAIQAVGPWLRDPSFVRVAIRVVRAAVKRDPSLAAIAMATLKSAKDDGVATEDLVALIRELKPRPAAGKSPPPSPTSGDFAHALYHRAKQIDPHNRGLRPDRLYQSMKGASVMLDRDETAVRSALNTAKDLFTKSGPRFRWRPEPRLGEVDGLSGARLADLAWNLARAEDPHRLGMWYQDIRRHLESQGVRIAGVNPGGTMHGALSGSEYFASAKHRRGRFVWKPRGV